MEYKGRCRIEYNWGPTTAPEERRWRAWFARWCAALATSFPSGQPEFATSQIGRCVRPFRRPQATRKQARRRGEQDVCWWSVARIFSLWRAELLLAAPGQLICWSAREVWLWPNRKQ